MIVWLNTVRHLKPAQFLGRLRFMWWQPKPVLVEAPRLRAGRAGGLAFPAHTQRIFGQRTFRFLNETRELALPAGWQDVSPSRLWVYNLHYFEDLVAEGARDRVVWHRALMARWVAENPPFSGTGWEPYPLSIRIVNWIKWALAGGELEPAWRASLALQAEYLSHRIEWHLMGNHLFENARALVTAGVFFEGAVAKRWLARGVAILDRQLREQILADGGHFERSPMYHALVLEGLLDLIHICEHFGVNADRTPRWRLLAGQVSAWLRAMTHPDGEIAFFNDAAFDVALPPTALVEYARRLGVRDSQVHRKAVRSASQTLHAGSPLPAAGEGAEVGEGADVGGGDDVGEGTNWRQAPIATPAASAQRRSEGITYLEASGYLRAVRGPVVALLDAAPLGPNYQPGHGHADTLSFELSVAGRRVLVNSGTSVYGLGAERLRQRGTAAHNTVVVDDKNSSEVWSGFRVGRRARPFDIAIRGTGDSWQIRAAHAGYRRLFGGATHRRTWTLGEKHLAIEDSVSGRHRSAVAYFHFHPAVDVRFDDARGEAVWDGGRVTFQVTEGSGLLQRSSYHPSFGVSLDNVCLVVRLNNGKSRVVFAA